MSDPAIWREHGTPLLPAIASGPLDGKTVAVKDLFAVTGFLVGAGNPAWLAQAEPETADAWAVRTLRGAGASIAGIARTDELAFSLSGANAHYGTPPNPAAPGLVTGGSSSGPASAVATGQADIGLGTDTAGSVRVPASVCGLFGLRPTHGAIPADGLVQLAPSFDTVGWLTVSASLLAGVGSVLLPPGPAAPPRRLLTLDLTNGSVRRLACSTGLSVLPGRVLGADDVTALLAAFRAVQAAEAWGLHGRWITANPGALSADVEARFRAGADVGADALRRATETIAGYRDRVLRAVTEDTWLALPAAAGPGHARDAAPEARDAWRQATLRRTVLASAFGLPSCVIPGAGSLDAWHPVPGARPLNGGRPPEGIALIGPPGADRALLTTVLAVAGPEPGGM